VKQVAESVAPNAYNGEPKKGLNISLVLKRKGGKTGTEFLAHSRNFLYCLANGPNRQGQIRVDI